MDFEKKYLKYKFKYQNLKEDFFNKYDNNEFDMVGGGILDDILSLFQPKLDETIETSSDQSGGKRGKGRGRKGKGRKGKGRKSKGRKSKGRKGKRREGEEGDDEGGYERDDGFDDMMEERAERRAGVLMYKLASSRAVSNSPSNQSSM